MSFEDALAELEQIVRRLEGGGLTLEESLQLWERGEHLAAIRMVDGYYAYNGNNPIGRVNRPSTD